MNTKSNIPDEVVLFSRQFSFWKTFKVARGWFLALIISALCDVVFGQQAKQWPLEWRVVIILSEFFAMLLFAFDAARWIRGMDELQRRVTLTIFLFAVSASFFFFVLWLRLERAGFFNFVFGPPVMNGTWGISSVAHVCVLLGGFYGLGFLIFKRRYK